MPPATATVYVDESYNLGDRNFVITAVIVPHAQANALLAEWTALQRDITEVLLREYPTARGHLTRQPGLLAEIHAVTMFQSSGYYRKYRRHELNPEPYYLQHYAWLQRAFEIQARYALPTVAFVVPDIDLLHPHRRGLPLFSEAIRASWNAEALPVAALDAIAQEMDRLETKPFTFALPRLITLLDRILAQQGMVADVVCDDDEENNRFSTFSIFEALQRWGQYCHLRKPTFASSETSAFLQMADNMAYVLRRHSADEQNGRMSKPEISTWFEMVQPQLVALPAITARDEAHHYAMMSEYVLLNAGGPTKVREGLLHTTSSLLFQIAESLAK